MDPFEAITEGAAAVASIAIFSNIFSYAALIALYVMGSLGLYTIAKRREISNAWMAWVPGLSMWILGSISDQYQYVTKDKVRNRRKWMIALTIALVVLVIAVYVCMFVSYFQIIFDVASNPDMELMDEMQVVEMVLKPFIPTFVILGVYMVVGIVQTVLQYTCYYNLFASCDPENKTLFLVLSILLNILLPIFTFVCRKKDLGMPPRKDAPAAYIPQPAYQAPQSAAAPEQPAAQPAYEAPRQPTQPWTQPAQPAQETQTTEEAPNE